MISAILLSGGSGTRMGSSIPKQYLPIRGKPLILHTLDALLSFQDWGEIAVVCEESYTPLFAPYGKYPLRFALPGKERQDSVFAGAEVLSPLTKFVSIHDGARPLLKPKDLINVIEAGKLHGAATLGIPVKATIKEVDGNLFVEKTLAKSKLFEIQTPQVISYHLLQKGRAFVEKEKKLVTDDVSLAEILGVRVKIVPGSDDNIKVTTPLDLALVELLLRKR